TKLARSPNPDTEGDGTVDAQILAEEAAWPNPDEALVPTPTSVILAEEAAWPNPDGEATTPPPRSSRCNFNQFARAAGEFPMAVAKGALAPGTEVNFWLWKFPLHANVLQEIHQIGIVIRFGE
ncbi:MAG: hypothetical protein KDK26_03750, partial [Roseivivax sp.]|nr:hypothetical protein [Roseivivax sp.]